MTAAARDVCADPAMVDQWYAIAALEEVPADAPAATVLLGVDVSFGVDEAGAPVVWRGASGSGHGEPLPVRADFGYLWTSVGDPPELFAVPEVAEADRRTLNAATIGIATSTGRAIENFLDMAHFPYVHTGVLGAEPYTEVEEYSIEMRAGEIWAVGCRFYQPLAAAASTDGTVVDYVYRVPHPACAMLYKSAPTDDGRMDAIGIFVQPVGEEFVRAHLFLSLVDDVSADAGIRRFQQTIFGQDKPILENQYPKRLPLDPRAETPIRADRSAIAYRRWLSDLGVTYGVIPA